MRKNPAVALGVVLTRLLQKDEEWCAPKLAPPLALIPAVASWLRQ